MMELHNPPEVNELLRVLVGSGFQNCHSVREVLQMRLGDCELLGGMLAVS